MHGRKGNKGGRGDKVDAVSRNRREKMMTQQWRDGGVNDRYAVTCCTSKAIANKHVGVKSDPSRCAECSAMAQDVVL